MKLIVGLGNPDRKYEHTFHNLGFMAINKFAEKIDAHFTKRMCDGLVAEGYFAGQKLLLLKPLTYMNLSGISVRQIAQKFKLLPQDIYVFVDDIDLPLGKVRYRESGSAGTHNGLKSIVNELGSTEFKRIKIGIGRDEKFADLADYVLSRIPDEKIDIINLEILTACDFVLDKLKNKE